MKSICDIAYTNKSETFNLFFQRKKKIIFLAHDLFFRHKNVNKIILLNLQKFNN